MQTRFVKSLLLGASLYALQTAAGAQQDATDKKVEGLDFDTIVVTASSNNSSKMQSSVSVSNLDPEKIEQAAPSSVADILRNVPGIRSEASGGEGNANVSVRGLPLASGGAKYVQFQEDGLPVLQFGDIDFATDLSNFTDDLKVTHDLQIAGGDTHVTFGYYHDTQTINEDWHWNEYLEAATGKNAALLNVTNASGKPVTLNGLVGYNAGFGYCCVRTYNIDYATDAPYVAATWQQGPLSLDASLRADFVSASGSYAGGGAVQQLATGNAAVATLPGVLNDPSTALPVDYSKHYLSYSVGANYLLDPSMALFVRSPAMPRIRPKWAINRSAKPNSSISSTQPTIPMIMMSASM